jgi:hypothetical protein
MSECSHILGRHSPVGTKPVPGWKGCAEAPSTQRSATSAPMRRACSICTHSIMQQYLDALERHTKLQGEWHKRSIKQHVKASMVGHGMRAGRRLAKCAYLHTGSSCMPLTYSLRYVD